MDDLTTVTNISIPTSAVLLTIPPLNMSVSMSGPQPPFTIIKLLQQDPSLKRKSGEKQANTVLFSFVEDTIAHSNILYLYVPTSRS